MSIVLTQSHQVVEEGVPSLVRVVDEEDGDDNLCKLVQDDRRSPLVHREPRVKKLSQKRPVLLTIRLIPASRTEQPVIWVRHVTPLHIPELDVTFDNKEAEKLPALLHIRDCKSLDADPPSIRIFFQSLEESQCLIIRRTLVTRHSTRSRKNAPLSEQQNRRSSRHWTLIRCPSPCEEWLDP